MAQPRTSAEIPLDDATLATLVSNVTKSMLGIPFVVSSGPPREAIGESKMAMLTISGKPGLLIALSSDEVGCNVLGSTMFACAPDQLDPSLIADALGELVNMTAGQIKIALAKKDEALGLPKVVPPNDRTMHSVTWRTVRLRAEGLELVLWLGMNII